MEKLAQFISHQKDDHTSFDRTGGSMFVVHVIQLFTVTKWE